MSFRQVAECTVLTVVAGVGWATVGLMSAVGFVAACDLSKFVITRVIDQGMWILYGV